MGVLGILTWSTRFYGDGLNETAIALPVLKYPRNFRGVAYYVILPRQGVWGTGAKPLISDFEQFRVYLGPVVLQNSHKNMSQLYTIVHS